MKEEGSHLSRPSLPLLSLRLRVFHPTTRIHVRLLGPCFKTGLMRAFTLDQESKKCQKAASQSKKSSKHFFQSPNLTPHHATFQHGCNPLLFCFLRQTGSVPPRVVTCRSEATNPKQAFPYPKSNASRGPDKCSAAILTSKSHSMSLSLTEVQPLASPA